MKRVRFPLQSAGAHRAHGSRSRTIGAAVVVGLIVAGLSGCTVEKEPPVYPDVLWEGTSPSGPLESDPWVQAVRAELEAEAVALNRNDFSLPQLAQRATPTYIDRVSANAIRTVSSNGTTYLLPGPLPFLPVEVQVGYANKGEDFAAVSGCVAGEWATESGEHDGQIDSFGRMYRVERDSDGLIRVDSTASLPDLDCEAAGPLPIALFDPVPEPSGVTEVDDVVRPDGTTSGGLRRGGTSPQG